jgi:hypothetical protein
VPFGVDGTQEQEVSESLAQPAGVSGPTDDGKKSLHKQSFVQHSFALSKGIAQENPCLQRVSEALLKSRVCPLQSLSELHWAVQ